MSNITLYMLFLLQHSISKLNSNLQYQLSIFLQPKIVPDHVEYFKCPKAFSRTSYPLTQIIPKLKRIIRYSLKTSLDKMAAELQGLVTKYRLVLDLRSSRDLGDTASLLSLLLVTLAPKYSHLPGAVHYRANPRGCQGANDPIHSS